MRNVLPFAAVILIGNLCACGSGEETAETDGPEFGSDIDGYETEVHRGSSPPPPQPPNVVPCNGQSDWFRLAIVRVRNQPLPGQNWRSSSNIDLTTIPPLTTLSMWLIVDPPAQKSAIFELAIDIPWHRDKHLPDDIRDGSIGPIMPRSNRYYIGGVRGASDWFWVEICGHQ